MSQKNFLTLAGVIFGLISLLHLVRLWRGWEAVIGGLNIPLWVSGVAFVLASILSFWAFRLLK